MSWGSGSHGPNGAHIGGLPRGPQPRGQTGATQEEPGGAELKVSVRQLSFPTGMGDPPELLDAHKSRIWNPRHDLGSGQVLGSRVPTVGQRGQKDVSAAPSPPALPAVRPRTGGV